MKDRNDRIEAVVDILEPGARGSQAFFGRAVQRILGINPSRATLSRYFQDRSKISEELEAKLDAVLDELEDEARAALQEKIDRLGG